MKLLVIKSYKEFESIFLSGDEEQKRWLNRIERIFKDLDVTGDDKQDVRVQQLKSTFIAICKLIIAIEESGLETSPFPKTTIDEVIKCIKQNEGADA